MRHILHVFPTFDLGGQQIRLLDLVRSLRGRARHTVLALDGRTGCAARLDPTDEVALLPFLRDGGPLPQRLYRQCGVLAGIGADLLCTYNWGSIEWALANRLGPRLPHLHFEDGFGPEESPDRQLQRRVLARRWTLSGEPVRVVVPSRTLERVALERWRLPPARLRYIPNGIDLDRFARPPDSELLGRLGVTEGMRVVGCVGALRPEKNLGRLLAAMALLPQDLPWCLLVVGDGPERPRLEAVAAQSGLTARVRFTGRLDQPERLLGRFDVFAMSSDTEQMPYGVLEAMAASRPVAATDVGDIATMVAPDNRPFLVPAAGPDGLAGALARLLADAPLRRRLGVANRRKAEAEYGLGRMVATYAKLMGLADRP